MSTPFKVVILSASGNNLRACVAAIFKHEPQISPADIIVVKDGNYHGAQSMLPLLTWVNGEKPFQFSRNANIGMRAAGDADVILCCDDAILQTPGGFSKMAKAGRIFRGLTSATIQGVVANDNQKRDPSDCCLDMRREDNLLCFICMFILRDVWNIIGEMDERFTGYGYEDNDYSRRTQIAGMRLWVCEQCVVEHESQPSVWRTNRDITPLLEHNRQLYLDKWGQGSL
jgi:hypothetical protein